MSTMKVNGKTIFKDLGKVVNGTLLTNNVAIGTTKMYSLTLSKGVWLCVFMYRTDNYGGITFVGFNNTPVGNDVNRASTAIEVRTITSDNTVVYGTTYLPSGATAYTWSSGGRLCYAVKIA